MRERQRPGGGGGGLGVGSNPSAVVLTKQCTQRQFWGAQVPVLSPNDHPNPSEGQQKDFIKNGMLKKNSIAFGSAPRREVDSQPISPLARPAVSQTETHSLGFLSVADAAPSSGETCSMGLSSSRMAMQLTAAFTVAGSNPGQVNLAPPPPTVGRPGFEPPTKNFVLAALPFHQRWSDSDLLPHCLEPSQRKLLTPPPPPPPTPPPAPKK